MDLPSTSSAASPSSDMDVDTFQYLKNDIRSFFSDIHIKRNHFWMCKLCDHEFELKSDIMQHLKFHHNIPRMQFDNSNVQNKEIQDDMFKDELFQNIIFFKLKERLPSVVDKHLFTFKCVFCNCILKNIVDLMLHLLEEVNQECYRCKHCSVEFLSNKELTDHETRYDHQVANISVPNKIILTWAFDYVHDQMGTKINFNHDKNNENAYVCVMRDCSYSFTDGFNLQSHLFDHCCYKPLICEFCKERFADFRVLFNHIISNHNKSEFEFLKESISFIDKFVDSKVVECVHNDNLMEVKDCFICNEKDCTFQRDKISEYTLHRMNHYAHLYKCPYCSVEGTNDALSKHVFYEHNDILNLESKSSCSLPSGRGFTDNYCNLTEYATSIQKNSQECIADDVNQGDSKRNFPDDECDISDNATSSQNNFQECVDDVINQDNSGSTFMNGFCDISEFNTISQNDSQECVADVKNQLCSKSTFSVDCSNFSETATSIQNNSQQCVANEQQDNGNNAFPEKSLTDLFKYSKTENVLEGVNNSAATAYNNKVFDQIENKALISNPEDKSLSKNQDFLEMIIVYKCNYCQFRTVIMDCIKKHLTQFHCNGEPKYESKWQNKLEWYLQVSMIDGIEDEDFKCLYCTFTSKIESLIRHLVDNHPFVYVCGNCSKIFSSIKKVVEHDRLNHIKQNMKIFLLYDKEVLTLKADNFFVENSCLPLYECADTLQMIDVTEYKYRVLRDSNCPFA